MNIPIENLYYLLCYAWNKLDQGKIAATGGIEGRNVADLLATVLIRGVSHVLRTGLDRGYVECEIDTHCPRGRIDFNTSLKRYLFPRSKAHCRVDELTHDILNNQILKRTVEELMRFKDLDADIRKQLVSVYRRLPILSSISINRLSFRRVQIHSNNAFYGFLMMVCELVHNSLLPTEEQGESRFYDFVRDERKMASVFERFVLNFYRIECPQLDVKSERITWDAEAQTAEERGFLPTMLTDVSIRGPDRTVIIDTKYYKDTFQVRYDSEKVRSGHLYQLFSYLMNLERKGGPDACAEGILLYPVIKESFDLRYTIRGHKVRIVALNLDQNWRGIEEDLLSLVA